MRADASTPTRKALDQSWTADVLSRTDDEPSSARARVASGVRHAGVVRGVAGTRPRSAAALARHNARVAVRERPLVQAALMSLLDSERRYDAMAADLVSASVAVGPAGPHALCGTLDAAAFASSGARQVQLDTEAITAYFRPRVAAPEPVIRAMSAGLSGAVGASVGSFRFGHLALDVLLRSVVVLVCPDLDQCDARQRVLDALSRPGSAATLAGLQLFTGAGR